MSFSKMSSVMMRGANTRASVGGRRLNRRGCAQRVACRSMMEARSMATVPAMKTPDCSEEALIMEVTTKSGALDTPAAANHGEEEDGEMEYEDYSTTSKTYDTTRAPIGLDSLTRALEIAAGDRPAEELKLLDVGCGTGNYLDVVKHQVGSCHGLEFNEGMLAQSLAKHAGDERVSLMEGSVLDMSCFDASSFDTVIMTQVLHHLTPQTHSQALSEISRVLKPGGTFWISTQTPIQHMEGFWWAPLIPQAAATVSSPISILPATSVRARADSRAKSIPFLTPYVCLFQLAARFPGNPRFSRQLVSAGLQPHSIDVPDAPLMKLEAYLDLQGPFSQLYRDGDSTWSLAAPEELEAGLDWWQSMHDSGNAESWLADREKIRSEVGQTSAVTSVKAA